MLINSTAGLDAYIASYNATGPDIQCGLRKMQSFLSCKIVPIIYTLLYIGPYYGFTLTCEVGLIITFNFH